MTVNEHILRECVSALRLIIGEGRFADSVLQKKFYENQTWRTTERNFFAQAIYGIMRNWRKLWYAIGQTPSDNNLHLQYIVLTYIAHNGVAANREVRSHFDAEMIRRFEKAYATPSKAVMEYSYPDWLYEAIEQELGETTEPILQAMHKAPRVILRVNTLKTTNQKILDALHQREIPAETSPNAENAIALQEYANVFGLQEWKDGLFEVQDDGSQAIGAFCKVQPGMRVIDACAGSGGKTLHLGALMNNKGRIIALDTEEWKLLDLQKRSKRAGCSIIETRHINSTKVVKRLYDSADVVLIDAPCSGLGVMRRNPDTKWHTTQESINRCTTIQRDILQRYARMAKVGGAVVYATCSILPSEGERMVEEFLQKNTDFVLDSEQRMSPHIHNTDGFYMARIKRIS